MTTQLPRRYDAAASLKPCVVIAASFQIELLPRRYDAAASLKHRHDGAALVRPADRFRGVTTPRPH